MQKNLKKKKNQGSNFKDSKYFEDDISSEFENQILDDEYSNPENIEFVEKDIEDNENFVNELNIFKETHKNSKLIKVRKLIGKINFKKLKTKDDKLINDEYRSLVDLLDIHGIIVHFKNEYPVGEKYRFIVDEILDQEVEDFRQTHLHINFIYEDFHPEKDIEDEENEEF
jgi:hypothetical protein